MVRVCVPPHGNCFFLSIAYAIRNHIIGNQLVPSDLARHMSHLDFCLAVTHMKCVPGQENNVHKWMSHPEEYQPFLSANQTLNFEAQLFLSDRHFASDLGSSMPLAIANLLKIPVVNMTQMEHLPVIPVSPRESLQSLPIFVASEHSGTGHCDAVHHITKIQPSTDTTVFFNSC